MIVELGLGAVEVLASHHPGPGQVVGVYVKAAYLRLSGGLIALTTFAVPAGPIHARTSVPLSGLRVGDPVTVTGSSLQAGPVRVDLAGARTWRGRLPAAADLVAAAPLVDELLATAPPPSIAIPADPAGDLAALAAEVGGRGPGLTPAGDDFLAGALLIAHVVSGTVALPEVRTNDIALAFLRWAARGQSIEPVHRFLLSAAAGDAPAARHALDSLLRFGHSSGADLAAGLRAAVQWLCNDVVQAPAHLSEEEQRDRENR